MKHKVKFRVSSAAGKKAKFSINIEDGATFAMNPAVLGVAEAPKANLCLLQIENGELYAVGENQARIRLNNHEGSKFKVKAGDFIDTGELAVEFLEVPVPQVEEDDNAATRFLDISEQAKELKKAAPQAAVKKEPVRKEPINKEVINEEALQLSDLEPIKEAVPAPTPAPAAVAAPVETVPQEDEDDRDDLGEDSELEGMTTIHQLRDREAEVGAKIQALVKRGGKKGRRELRRLKRVQKEIQQRQVQLTAKEAERPAAPASIAHEKTHPKVEAVVARPHVPHSRFENFSPSTVEKNLHKTTERKPEKKEERKAEPVQEKKPIQRTASKPARSETYPETQSSASLSSHKLEIARKLFPEDSEPLAIEMRAPQPKLLKWIFGGSAAAGVAMIVLLGIKGKQAAPPAEEQQVAENPYQAAMREPSSESKGLVSPEAAPAQQPTQAETSVVAVAPAIAPGAVPAAVPAAVAPPPAETVPAEAPLAAPARVSPPIERVQRPIEPRREATLARQSPQQSPQTPHPTSVVRDRFFTAIKAGDVKAVKRFVSSRSVDPNFTLEREKTPLMVAASKGHLSIVKYLVSIRANIDAQDAEGTTALMWAVHRGQRVVVEFLLKKGANPNIRRDDGDRAVDIAKRWNQYDIMRMLKAAASSDRKIAGQPHSSKRKKRH